MAYRLPSHLHRSRSGILHFRIAIPADIRHHFPLAEVYRSLHTAKVHEAGPMAQRLALSFKALFRQLREDAMCAIKKKQNSDGGFTIGWITEISLDELRRPSMVKFTSEPDDPPGAMESAIRAVLEATPLAPTAEVTVGRATAINPTVVSDYVEPYLKHVQTVSNPSSKTLDSYRAAVELFIEIVGDKPLHKLNVTDQNRFEDIIVKLPANRTKIACARALSIDQAVALEATKVSHQTAKNNAQRANSFLAWAFRREGSKPPFELMGNVRRTARTKTPDRRAFNDDELRTLFDPAKYAKGRSQSPYMYWLPLIGLHSGMRINEIAQLRLADIVTRDGLTCFNVTDVDGGNKDEGSHGKKLKTDAARRIVPVHDALVGLGLLDYVRSLKQEGFTALFPELAGGRDGPGQPASKYFARYCDRVGLNDPSLVFHSFRHGAIGRMRASGIPKEVRMVVVGHAAAEDTHDAYGDRMNDFSLSARKRAIDALQFEAVLDYGRLRETAPTMAVLHKAIARSKTRPEPR